LIAGCGYVGSALGEQLVARGDQVWGLRRDPSGLPTGIQPIAADLGDPATLSALPGPFDLVFYTAGANEFSDAAYKRAYVDGLRNTLAAIQGSGGAGRVVFTSSTAVYAQDDGSWVDESSPTDPTSFSGQRVLEGERLLRSTHNDSVVLRLGGIYGPGRTGLIDRVRKGEARRDPADTRYLNLIHRDDIVGALLHVAELEAPAPTYIGVDNEPQNYYALLEWVADEVGVPVPQGSDAPQTRGRPVRNRRCSNKRLVDGGYQFRYPDARNGYRALLQDTAIRR
jgi:nucleoside-diphosphate-sugar epimerase